MRHDFPDFGDVNLRDSDDEEQDAEPYVLYAPKKLPQFITKYSQ